MNKEIRTIDLSLDPPPSQAVLAVGGELKSSVCLLAGNRALLTQPVGPLNEPQNFRAFHEKVKAFMEGSPAPVRVACDLHPDYGATRHARTLGLPLFEVQHHHAHIVSAMADNQLNQPVVGLACDGTGLGTDGAIWGCEALVCDRERFHRAGHLDYFPLLGGDAAALETWRPAAGLLFEALGPHWLAESRDLFADVDPRALSLMGRRLEGPARATLCSSLGRLFDGAAFLLGLCARNEEEAQAPRALEKVARDGDEAIEPLSYSLLAGQEDEPLRVDFRPLVRELVHQRRKNAPVADSARAFHLAVAGFLADLAGAAGHQTGRDRVALSGGCFFNGLLLKTVSKNLEGLGLEVFIHERVSPGDEGLALGQAVAASRMKRKELC